MTIEMDCRGGRVFRIEVIAHNTRQLRCGKRIDRFLQITASLMALLERFLDVLRGPMFRSSTMESWGHGLLASKVEATHVAGVDVNRPRSQVVMEAVIALSINLRGFNVVDPASKVREVWGYQGPLSFFAGFLRLEKVSR